MRDHAEIITDASLPTTIEGQAKKGSGVKFIRTSDHMDEGFPGKLKVESSYLISSDNELYFNWKAWLVDGQDSGT
jgi:galactose mutarotase-like enzyme